MNSRNLRILLLAIFGLWFGVIVPGHERGAITVPGFKPACAGPSCEAPANTAPRQCGDCPTDSDSKESKRERARHCAVCQLTGVLGAPAVIHFAPPTVELIGCLPLPAYESVRGIDTCDLIRSRGPPITSCAA